MNIRLLLNKMDDQETVWTLYKKEDIDGTPVHGLKVHVLKLAFVLNITDLVEL